MKVSTTHGLVIDAPEFFADPEFVAWLNDRTTPVFTWHDGGTPHSSSDVVVLVDPSLSGDGSGSDMPAHLWDQIVAACAQRFRANSTENGDHIMVWLKNLY